MAIGQASPSAFTSAQRFDGLHRLVGVISPDPDGTGPLKFAATRNSYDPAGRLIKVEKGELASWQPESIDPAAWVGFTVLTSVETSYDAQDHKIKEQSKDGSGVVSAVAQYNYDVVGRPLCTAVRMDPGQWAGQSDACAPQTNGNNGPDRVTKSIYDAGGQVIQVRKAVGTPLEQAYATYSYTPNGSQQDVIDANGNRARFDYDGFDRLAKWTFPSPVRPTGFDPSNAASALSTAGAVNGSDYEQYGYDQNGNRTSLRKRDGNTIGYGYDALNRMVSKDGPGTAIDVNYSYDFQGHQLSALFTASGQGNSNVYDDFGRLSSATSTMGAMSRTLGYQYDANGNRTRLTFPDGQFFQYGYDGLDRLQSISENGTTQIVSESYDARGFLGGRSRASGASSTFGYDAIGRLRCLRHDFAGAEGAPACDDSTLIATNRDMALRFSYNPASQIMQREAPNDAFAWDGSVSVNRNYATNGLNQYTGAGAASFTYDANGNLTSDGSANYIYDVENRLTTAGGSLNAGLIYDPLGRLYQTSNASTITSRFLYSGDELVAEYDGSGNLQRRYIHGDKDDDPLVWYEGANLNDRRDVQADQQGSVVAVSDNAAHAGTVNSYDEYGIPSSSNSGRFQYTGQTWISEVGMYYYKARIYSPTLGRFLQTDPVGYKDEIDLYAYVGNDPLNRTDPLGLYECSGNKSQCGAVSDAYAQATKALKSGNLSKGEQSKLQDALNTLGRPGSKNGVTISFANPKDIASKVGSGFAYTEKTDAGANVVLPSTFATSFSSWKNNAASPVASKGGTFSPESARGNALAHEGKHAQQFKQGMTQEQYNRNPSPREVDAYRTGNAVTKALGAVSPFPEP